MGISVIFVICLVLCSCVSAKDLGGRSDSESAESNSNSDASKSDESETSSEDTTTEESSSTAGPSSTEGSIATEASSTTEGSNTTGGIPIINITPGEDIVDETTVNPIDSNETEPGSQSQESSESAESNSNSEASNSDESETSSEDTTTEESSSTAGPISTEGSIATEASSTTEGSNTTGGIPIINITPGEDIVDETTVNPIVSNETESGSQSQESSESAESNSNSEASNSDESETSSEDTTTEESSSTAGPSSTEGSIATEASSTTEGSNTTGGIPIINITPGEDIVDETTVNPIVSNETESGSQSQESSESAESNSNSEASNSDESETSSEDTTTEESSSTAGPSSTEGSIATEASSTTEGSNTTGGIPIINITPGEDIVDETTVNPIVSNETESGSQSQESSESAESNSNSEASNSDESETSSEDTTTEESSSTAGPISTEGSIATEASSTTEGSNTTGGIPIINITPGEDIVDETTVNPIVSNETESGSQSQESSESAESNSNSEASNSDESETSSEDTTTEESSSTAGPSSTEGSIATEASSTTEGSNTTGGIPIINITPGEDIVDETTVNPIVSNETESGSQSQESSESAESNSNSEASNSDESETSSEDTTTEESSSTAGPSSTEGSIATEASSTTEGSNTTGGIPIINITPGEDIVDETTVNPIVSNETESGSQSQESSESAESNSNSEASNSDESETSSEDTTTEESRSTAEPSSTEGSSTTDGSNTTEGSNTTGGIPVINITPGEDIVVETTGNPSVSNETESGSQSQESSESEGSSEEFTTEAPGEPDDVQTIESLNADLTAEKVMGWMMKENASNAAKLQTSLKRCWALEKKLGKHPESSGPPEVVQPLIGDVMIDQAKVDAVIEELENELKTGDRKKRKIYKAYCNYWPTTINYQMSLGTTEAQGTLEAISIFETTTCLNFVSSSSNPKMVFSQTSSGCWSYLCRVYTSQTVNIGDGCSNSVGRPGIPWHEIAHALGMVHEQSRSDRDNYVDILWNNIDPKHSGNFQKCSNCAPDVPYDFESVMHYGKGSFSVNGNPAILPLSQYSLYTNTYGSMREGPAFLDTKAINLIYCKGVCADDSFCTNGGYRNPSNCNQCNCPDGFAGQTCSDLADSMAGCGGFETATSVWQNLQSLNYGNTISGSMECIWKIDAAPGQTIEFQFTNDMFFGRQYYTGDCIYNYVEVKYRNDLTLGGARFCMNNAYPAATIPSEGSTMMVLFRRTYISGTDKGFIARYRAVGVPDVSTASPTTAGPTTAAPTTAAPTTAAPTTAAPTTAAPTTAAPITAAPTTAAPTTAAPTTAAPTTAAPTTAAPTTAVPTTAAPTTAFSGGDCCAAHATPECSLSQCTTAICEQDSFCCSSYWDYLCVNHAKASAACPCDNCEANPCVHGTCTSTSTSFQCACDEGWEGTRCDIKQVHECCASKRSRGCPSNLECQNIVCSGSSLNNADQYCCNTRWDSICARTARNVCPICSV